MEGTLLNQNVSTSQDGHEAVHVDFAAFLVEGVEVTREVQHHLCRVLDRRQSWVIAVAEHLGTKELKSGVSSGDLGQLEKLLMSPKLTLSLCSSDHDP